MGTRRIKIIEMILHSVSILYLLYCFCCVFLFLNDMLLHFDLRKYLLPIFNFVKNEEIIKITFSFLLSSSFSGVLFFYGIRRERKKEEKNQRLAWYTELVLNNLQRRFQEYFNLTEDYFNDTDLNKEKHRLERNKIRKELECLIIFDKKLYTELIKILSNSIDNFSSEKSIEEKIKKNTNLKVVMLKKLLDQTKLI